MCVTHYTLLPVLRISDANLNFVFNELPTAYENAFELDGSDMSMEYRF